MGFDQDHALETYKSMINIGTEALKALILINGGAIVALLAFLGQVQYGSELAAMSFRPMSLFVLGLVFAILAFLGTYFTQFVLFNECVNNKIKGLKHTFYLVITVLLLLLSLVSFVFGSYSTLYLFSYVK